MGCKYLCCSCKNTGNVIGCFLAGWNSIQSGQFWTTIGRIIAWNCTLILKLCQYIFRGKVTYLQSQRRFLFSIRLLFKIIINPCYFHGHISRRMQSLEYNNEIKWFWFNWMNCVIWNSAYSFQIHAYSFFKFE